MPASFVFLSVAGLFQPENVFQIIKTFGIIVVSSFSFIHDQVKIVFIKNNFVFAGFNILLFSVFAPVGLENIIMPDKNTIPGKDNEYRH